MIDLGNLFDGLGSFRLFGNAPMGVFTFVVLLSAIGAATSWFKARAVQETIREAIREGRPLDPATIRELRGESEEDKHVSRVLPACILLAVAAALVLFGWAIGQVSDDGTAFVVFLGIAAFPGLIGLAFLASDRLERADA